MNEIQGLMNDIRKTLMVGKKTQEFICEADRKNQMLVKDPEDLIFLSELFFTFFYENISDSDGNNL